MKRFVSVLLVAMLVVTSMCVAGFAADVEVEAGTTSVEIPVTVYGPIAGCKVRVQSTDVLTVTGIRGNADTTINAAKGIVVWSSASNVDNYTFYVTVDIAEGTPAGTYALGLVVDQASKVVSAEEDTDGIADGWMRFDGTASGSVTIKEKATEEPTTEEPTTEPVTEEPTTEPTTEEPTEKPTEKPTEAPTQKPTEAPAQKPTEGEKDDVPETGDISTQVYMTGALVLVLMAAAVALVTKRRSVK